MTAGQADQLLLSIGLGLDLPGRGAPVHRIGCLERRTQDRIGAQAPEERTRRGVRGTGSGDGRNPSHDNLLAHGAHVAVGRDPCVGFGCLERRGIAPLERREAASAFLHGPSRCSAVESAAV
jgi:hypothetical protein